MAPVADAAAVPPWLVLGLTSAWRRSATIPAAPRPDLAVRGGAGDVTVTELIEASPAISCTGPAAGWRAGSPGPRRLERRAASAAAARRASWPGRPADRGRDHRPRCGRGLLVGKSGSTCATPWTCCADGRRTTIARFLAQLGWHLLDRRDDGRHLVTDDFLRAYLLRPELRPVESPARPSAGCTRPCSKRPPADHAGGPAAAEGPGRARELRGLRALSRPAAAQRTLEDAYLRWPSAPRPASRPCSSSIWRTRSCAASSTAAATACACAPPSACSAPRASPSGTAPSSWPTPTRCRSTPDRRHGQPGPAPGRGAGAHPRGRARRPGEANAADYLARSDRFDTVLDVSFTRPGLDALCRVLEAWVRHFLAIEVSIQPLQSVRDQRWRWHVGLDAEATALLNALYAGQELGEDRQARLLSLFRLEFKDPSWSPGRARPAGLSGHGAERRARAAAEAAEPPGEPAAGGGGLKQDGRMGDERRRLEHEPAQVPEEGGRDRAARDRERDQGGPGVGRLKGNEKLPAEVRLTIPGRTRRGDRRRDRARVAADGAGRPAAPRCSRDPGSGRVRRVRPGHRRPRPVPVAGPVRQAGTAWPQACRDRPGEGGRPAHRRAGDDPPPEARRRMPLAAAAHGHVTGAGRGLGLGLAASYAADGWHVLGTARDPDRARALHGCAAAVVHALDVTDPDSVRTLSLALAGEPVDLLINSASLEGAAGAALGDLGYAAWAWAHQGRQPLRPLPRRRKPSLPTCAPVASSDRHRRPDRRASCSRSALPCTPRRAAPPAGSPGKGSRWSSCSRPPSSRSRPTCATCGASIDSLASADTGSCLASDGTPLPW